jgi:putative hydrolase of the HAD superfamily
LKLRAVLLDAAGTLIHPSEAVGETYARIAREHGVDVPAWRVDDAFRRVLRSAPPMIVADDAGERAWWRDLVRATFRAADQMQRFADFEACFDALFAHFARPEAWRAAPGAHAALATLRRAGRCVAVASNFDSRLPAILAGLDLARDLDLIWLPRDAGVAKPDPAFLPLSLRSARRGARAGRRRRRRPGAGPGGRASRRTPRDRRHVAC